MKRLRHNLKTRLGDLLPEPPPAASFSWREELFAGFMGALIVIPQGITFAYLAGLTPENGLMAAIFTTLIISLFSSTPLIGGPNTAVAILIGYAILPFAGRGSDLFFSYAAWLSILVGVLQLAAWLGNGARLFRVFSPAAIAAINMGVGVTIIMAAIEGLLGTQPLATRFLFQKITIIITNGGDLINPYAATVGLSSLLLGLLVRRYYRRFAILAAMVWGGCLSFLLLKWDPFTVQLSVLGHIPLSTTYLGIPTWTSDHRHVMEKLIPDAVIIAFIGLSQTLVIAQDLGRQGFKNLQLSRETLALGLANFAAPFLGGFAGSGSFNRTAMNIELGAKTKWAGMSSALFVALIIWAGTDILAFVSMPVIAALLMIVGISMIKVSVMRRVWQDRAERLIFWATISSVFFFGLKIGIILGAVLSLGFLAWGTSRLVITFAGPDNHQCRVSGALFFGNINELEAIVTRSQSQLQLDISQLNYIDDAARRALESWRQAGVITHNQ